MPLPPWQGPGCECFADDETHILLIVVAHEGRWYLDPLDERNDGHIEI